MEKQKEWLEYSKLDAKTSKRCGAPVRGAGLKIAGLVDIADYLLMNVLVH